MPDKNKRGQIGTTLTWMVATVIIIVFLIISVFIVSFYGIGNGKTVSENRESDSLARKSFFAYLLTTEDDNIIYKRLKEGKSFTDFSGHLAERIFKGLYKKDYPEGVWIGYYLGEETISSPSNDYFGGRPSSKRGSGTAGSYDVGYVSEKVGLEQNKDLELVLMNK